MSVTFTKDGTLYHPPLPKWENIEPQYKDMVGMELLKFKAGALERCHLADDGLFPHHKDQMTLAVATTQVALQQLGFPQLPPSNTIKMGEGTTTTEIPTTSQMEGPNPCWDEVPSGLKEHIYFVLIFAARKFAHNGYECQRAGLRLAEQRWANGCEAMHSAAIELGWNRSTAPAAASSKSLW